MKSITVSDLKLPGKGVIQLANGVKSTFQMTEFNPYRNWKWVGPFLWLTIHDDHLFESVNSNQTDVTFVLQARGLDVGFFVWLTIPEGYRLTQIAARVQ